ncbi:ATP-binding protein [Lentzea sp.]|uniref:ATP-binding protein n=1 Tax=Lentzea sp. TaxID=56099 RepID=UPI002BF20A22|nr:NB-ARC domain-containing protein [Lentzea sp.]HUQ58626.1 NB-ARC domain-containing protein [Lentzea sp.]
MADQAGAIRNQVSGSITGTSVQAGVVQGGVHIHQGDVTPVPRQLPSPPRSFTGRNAELELLQAIPHTGQSAKVVVLSGPGGVGKTALSLRWAASLREDFPDGQLFVDLNGFSSTAPTDPGEALGSFLRALGTAPERVPVHLAEQISLYRSLTAGKALLVVLDNALSAAQARVLVPPSPSSLVVVTSRSKLVGLVGDGAHLVEVGPLSAASAYKMFAGAVGDERVARERDHAKNLVALCDGLPIAIRVAAARLLLRSRWSVRRIHDELLDERSRLVNLSPSGELSVKATFDLSYRMLDPAAATAYRRLSLHPGGDFGPELVSAVLADSSRTDSLLEFLVDANLLEEHAEDRYRYLDLLRLHAAQRFESDDPREERLAALQRIAEWYLAAAMHADEVLTPYRRRLPYAFSSSPLSVPSFGDRDDALGWLERERVNLVGAGRAAFEHGFAELAWHLSDVLWPLFLLRKHYRDRMEVDERGVAAARQWGDEFALADMLKRLGRASTIARDFEAAERHLAESMELWTRMGDERGVCDAREYLALLYRETGREEEALAQFELLVEATTAMGMTRAAGLNLINLGRVLVDLDRAAEAVPRLVLAEGIFRELGATDPYNHARAVVALAAAEHRTGALAAADERARKGLGLMEALGSDHGRAEALHVLGEVAYGLNRATEAREHLLAAEGIFRSLGSPQAQAVRERLAELE